MSNKIQTSKNIDLVNKLMQYLINGKNIPDLPDDVSFVPYSRSDKKLNNANEKLTKNLSKQNKPVATAQEPKTSGSEWKITPVNF